MDTNTMSTGGSKNTMLYVIIIVVVAILALGYYFWGSFGEAVVWDGNYTMTGTLTCEGNIPGVTTLPMDTTLTVANNMILEPEVDQSFAINRRGRASESIQQSLDNGVKTDIDAEYQFTKADDVYSFTADGTVVLSMTVAGQDLSSTCTGVISGEKQAEAAPATE